MLNHFAADVENELKHVDPNVQLVMESADQPATRIDTETTQKLIYSLHACPHGVIGMSHDIEGLVETSTNLASVKMERRQHNRGRNQPTAVPLNHARSQLQTRLLPLSCWQELK